MVNSKTLQQVMTQQANDDLEDCRQLLFGIMTGIKGNGESLTVDEINELPANYTDQDKEFLWAASDFINRTEGMKWGTEG